MSFVIRVRTSQGMHRFDFDSNQATFADLQSQIQDKYCVSPESQVISSTPPSRPEFIESDTGATLLTALGLKHGSMIYLILAQNQVQVMKASKSQETSDSKVDDTNSNSNNNNNDSKRKFALKPLPKGQRGGSRQVTLSTSKWVNDPKNKMVDSGPKHVPFHEWIEARQKKYAQKQPWMIDPPKYDFSAVPYRKNLKFSELPGNAVIKRQEYRHLDLITFKDVSPFARFKKSWEQIQSQLQQCCFLIGRYEKVPNKLKKSIKRQSNSNSNSRKQYLMAAHVYAIYEPPHTKHIRGVKFRTEKDELIVDRMIAACGMSRVGWCVTTMPRGDEKKYKGDIFMSGDEIFDAARLQSKYKNVNTGYSKFATLVVHVGNKEAQAYQISDQGVSMIKHALIEQDADPGFMKVKKPPPQVYVPSVINENGEIKTGLTFLPDALLVNVISTSASVQEHIFNYVHFPPRGSVDSMRQHLTHHRSEPFHSALSDFCLLTYLPKIIDIDLAVTIAQHVVAKKRMSAELTQKVTKAFKTAIPGWR